jgi:hypothetical protein
VEVQEAGPIGCLISGIPGHPVEDIQFCNIRIQLAEPAPQPRDIGSVPEKEDSYPEATQFGHLPAAGFFVRHARGVRFEAVEVIPHPDDPRAILASLDAGMETAIGSPGQPLRLRTCSD